MGVDSSFGFAIPSSFVYDFIENVRSNQQLKIENRERVAYRQAPLFPLRPKNTFRWLEPDHDSRSELRLDEKPQSRYLGLVMRSLTPNIVANLVSHGVLNPNCKLPGRTLTGVFIESVIRGSPADR